MSDFSSSLEFREHREEQKRIFDEKEKIATPIFMDGEQIVQFFLFAMHESCGLCLSRDDVSYPVNGETSMRVLGQPYDLKKPKEMIDECLKKNIPGKDLKVELLHVEPKFGEATTSRFYYGKLTIEGTSKNDAELIQGKMLWYGNYGPRRGIKALLKRHAKAFLGL